MVGAPPPRPAPPARPPVPARPAAPAAAPRPAAPRRRRRILVADAFDILAAVAPELGLNPVHRVAVALRALPTVAELREPLDRGLVPLEVKPTHERVHHGLGAVGGLAGRLRSSG